MAILSKGYGMIPNEIIYNEELSSSAKVFFSCVSSHMAERGYCFASNGYLAEKMGVKPRQIQRWLEELAGYLYIYEENGKRRISLHEGDAEQWGVSKKTRGGVKKDTHNNTSIISKKINKKDKAPKEDSEDKIFFYSLVQSLGLSPERTLFSPERHKKMLARLKNFSHDQLIIAAKAIKADPFMQGRNDRGTKYGTIDYLVRNDEKLEYWINQATPAITAFDQAKYDADIAEEERLAQEMRDAAN